MEETAYDIRQADTLAAWQQALAEVPQTPALSGALLRRRDDLFGRFVAWYGRLRSRPRAERRRWQRQLGLSLAPAGAMAPAATITVTNGTSTIANGDGCSLPEAIINANADNQSGSTDCTAGSGADIIDLQTNVTLTAVNNTTDGNNGLPLVTSAITIEGNGNFILRPFLSPAFRILAVASGANLTLNSARVLGGAASSGFPFPVGNGGGIHNRGALTVSNSTLSGNTAASEGGGIFNSFSGTATVSNSTLYGNGATGRGGGIYNANGTLAVSNSTLSGNFADRNGGGIFNSFSGTATVSNSTLSGSGSRYGGGGFFNSGTVTVSNSIVAAQLGVSDCTNSGGTLTSGGYNIESGRSCGFTGTGDLQMVPSDNLALGALANNGGPTLTRALGAGSVAIDRIPVGALEANGCGVTVTRDQRNAPRAGGPGNGGSACDVGAYEAGSTPLAVTLASFDAQAMADRIQLSWETVSEANNAGFNLYRSASPAAPGSTQGASYSYEDTEVSAGQTWYYWLEDVDLNGATSLHGPVSATLQAPTAVTLDALQAQAANPGSVTTWGALVAALIAAAGVLGVRRRSRAR